MNSTIASQNDFYIEGGEAIVYYHLDIRVTDPDAQWTPNATVQVENGFWNWDLNQRVHQGLVRFTTKLFNQSTSQYYVYTHQITVTMTNYSNSTSVFVDQYKSVIVALLRRIPGDITQDLFRQWLRR